MFGRFNEHPPPPNQSGFATPLILPSSPGYTSVTLPRVYFPLIALSSLYVTTSSTCTLRRSTCHFFRGSSNGNTSRLHRFQKESTNFWTNSTLCRGFFVFLNGPCMWHCWCCSPYRSMSFGDRYDPSSGSFGTLPIGRWLTKFPTSNK